METDMKISELAECLTVLLRKAEEQGPSEVTAPEDGYFTIPSPDWRDIYTDPPPTPGVGSFSDDEEELRKLLVSPERASAVDLERIAHLLLLLSDHMSE